jgi:hypothetical protein
MDDPRLTGPTMAPPDSAAEQRLYGDLSPCETPDDLLAATVWYAVHGWPQSTGAA